MSRTTLPKSLKRLAQDHIDMRMALSVLEREVDSVAQYHDADPEVLGDSVQYFAKFPRDCHHPIEEAIHRVLRARAPEAAVQAVCVGQHERIVELTGEFAMMMRNLFLDAPKWRVPFCATARSLITLKRDHIREEEKTFFRLALENLTDDDWATIDCLALDAHRVWTADPARVMTADVLRFRAHRAAHASGSARRP